MNTASFVQRVGLIGDVHGEADNLETTLFYLRAECLLDALFCTGDVPGKKGTAQTDRCVRLLQEANVQTVRGNHDRWASAETVHADDPQSYDASESYRRYASTLPTTREFTVSFGSGMLCHGVGMDDMVGIYPSSDDEQVRHALKERRLYGWYRVLISGHTHRRMVRQVGSVWILNPGTLRQNERPGFLIADFADGLVHFFDIPEGSNRVIPGETVSLIVEDAIP